MTRLFHVLFLSVFFLMGGLSTSCGGDDDAAKKAKKGKKVKKGKKGNKAKAGKLAKGKKAKKSKAGKLAKAGKAGGCTICWDCKSDNDCASGEYCQEEVGTCDGPECAYKYCTKKCNSMGADTCPSGSKCSPLGYCLNTDGGAEFPCKSAWKCPGGKKAGKGGKKSKAGKKGKKGKKGGKKGKKKGKKR